MKRVEALSSLAKKLNVTIHGSCSSRIRPPVGCVSQQYAEMNLEAPLPAKILALTLWAETRAEHEIRAAGV